MSDSTHEEDAMAGSKHDVQPWCIAAAEGILHRPRDGKQWLTNAFAAIIAKHYAAREMAKAVPLSARGVKDGKLTMPQPEVATAPKEEARELAERIFTVLELERELEFHKHDHAKHAIEREVALLVLRSQAFKAAESETLRWVEKFKKLEAKQDALQDEMLKLRQSSSRKAREIRELKRKAEDQS